MLPTDACEDQSAERRHLLAIAEDACRDARAAWEAADVARRDAEHARNALRAIRAQLNRRRRVSDDHLLSAINALLRIAGE